MTNDLQSGEPSSFSANYRLRAVRGNRFFDQMLKSKIKWQINESRVIFLQLVSGYNLSTLWEKFISQVSSWRTYEHLSRDKTCDEIFSNDLTVHRHINYQHHCEPCGKLFKSRSSVESSCHQVALRKQGRRSRKKIHSLDD